MREELKNTLVLFKAKEVFEIIERARINAITALACDGHDPSGYYVKNVNFIAGKIAILLIATEKPYSKENFLALCLLGFDLLYEKMFQEGVLPQEINTFEEFSARYVHFLHELDSELKRPLNILEDAVNKIQESFRGIATKKFEQREEDKLTLESLNVLSPSLKEKCEKYNTLLKIKEEN